jgi:CBS domain-containing protein
MSLLRLAQAPAPSVGVADTARQAAAAMRKHRVGALLVLDGRVPAGLLTERDLVRKLVAEGLDPKTTTVSALMSSDIASVPADATPETALALMSAKHVRHLVVVDKRRRPVGLLSHRHVAQARLASTAEELTTLEQFVTADGPGG